MSSDDLRPGEVAVDVPLRTDASLHFIGVIRTPFLTRADCPRQGDPDAGPICRLELAAPWRPAIAGLLEGARIDVLYWLHEARRDLVLQSPKRDGSTRGTFAIRSPVRPNPIGVSPCRVVDVSDGVVLVRGLDCLDGTPLLDIKPERCPFAVAAADGRQTGNL